jgi:uncharacterized membrane protein
LIWIVLAAAGAIFRTRISMIVLIVLFGSWLVFRGMGALGVSAFSAWHDTARYALAVMFAFAGISHFTRLKHDMVRMMPAIFPRPLLLVYITGLVELLGAVALLLPATRMAAGICLILFLLGVFPANVKAARENVLLNNKPATPLWLRLPMQILFIGLVWWSALR